MSSKGSKRRQRRINTTEEEVEKKSEEIEKKNEETGKKNEEIIEIIDERKSEVEKVDKEISLKEETKTENGEQTIENGEKIETIDTQKPETVETPPQELPPVETNENGVSNTNVESKNSQDDQNSDIEPLIVDTEDPELQFPSETGSETSEVEKSPVIRCKTRRSQTRNLPTPKTPKSLEYNTAEKEEKVHNLQELRVKVTRLETEVQIPEEVEKAEDVSVKSENVSVISNDCSTESSLSEKTQDTDITNASVIVNLGDTTQNLDITVNNFDSVVNSSDFIELTKDKTYGETLRCLSGRKTVRNISEPFKSRLFTTKTIFTTKDVIDSSKKYTPISGMKRKLDSSSPAEYKKQKVEESPGLLSYLSSPFKNKSRSDIPSSTPKLTSYKNVSHMSFDNLDTIEQETNKIEPKKWCSIM